MRERPQDEMRAGREPNTASNDPFFTRIDDFDM